MKKSTFEKELEGKRVRDLYDLHYCYNQDDVLSAKEKAKKEILKEIDKANKKHNYRILGSFYDGLEKAKRIIKENL